MPDLDPEKLDKYLYIEKTPTWLVRLIYSFGIAAWLLVVYGYSSAIFYDPFYRYFVAPLLGFITVYYLSSFILNLFYARPSISQHERIRRRYWEKIEKEPSVDVFLPICGEDLSILNNTWEYVFRLPYQNKHIYVLDDSRADCDKHKQLAEEYGFTYLERPNKGEMKKAGNLKFGFEHSSSEFVAIFDADFAPHPDFLYDLLPYTQDSNIAIVQSPQYFETTKSVHKRSILEYGASYVQEDFYRVIQVARDRLGGALCCGSNAIYRRSALEEIGGPLQVHYSEDSRTGIALVRRGWIIRYVPILLAIGLCPDGGYSYFHQQHRWCSGSMELLTSKDEFWSASMPWKARLCYVSGFLYYLHYPLAILMSFQLFFTLFYYNNYIRLVGLELFLPYMIFSFVILPLFHISRMKRGSFVASTLQLYAYTHAVVTVIIFRRAVDWIPANARQSVYSRAFRQASLLVGSYLLINVALLSLALRKGYIHLFNYNYYSIQLWIFWDITFAAVLLWFFYKAMDSIQITRVDAGLVSMSSLEGWRLRTVGIYLLITVGLFFGILYL